MLKIKQKQAFLIGKHFMSVVSLILTASLFCYANCQNLPDQEEVWSAFLDWFRTAPLNANPFRGYTEKLQKQGTSREEIERQAAILSKLFSERKDWVEIFFDRVYSKPVTGDPVRDGFNSSPSAFLIESTKELKPGLALDAGMGQGRNAVYLAQQGWDVTGFDISQKALDASHLNAEQAGVHIKTVKSSYEKFNFGKEKWDLIVLIFAWAPVSDPDFVTRLHTSLRRGGRIVFEHFIDDSERPYAGPIRALQPGKLRTFFSDFRIERYEEEEGIGDYGGPGSQLVRMVAQKKPPRAGLQ
ncbi:MAG: class I SAM-dependent methyltransferase [Candidatus Aminicenantes bacterium]|nr:MAG: class I SAM-dependent methyltransferase [Candidatus Aminicenantes bacterium]